MHQNKLNYIDYNQHRQANKWTSKNQLPLCARKSKKWFVSFALYGWPMGAKLPFFTCFSLVPIGL